MTVIVTMQNIYFVFPPLCLTNCLSLFLAPPDLPGALVHSMPLSAGSAGSCEMAPPGSLVHIDTSCGKSRSGSCICAAQ